MKLSSEKELCERFIEAHPRREHLFFEVDMPRGRADIVHKEHTIVTIYEAKLSLSIDLLEQCINRKDYCHYIYAVIPYSIRRRNSFLHKVFEDYGIGTIIVHDHDRYEGKIRPLEEIKKPKLNRSPKAITLYEENKTEIAGLKHAGITPFGIMVRKIKETLEWKSPQKIDTVFEQQSYYGTLKQFKSNIYQWIRVGVITGIKMEKGMLYHDNSNI